MDKIALLLKTHVHVNILVIFGNCAPQFCSPCCIVNDFGGFLGCCSKLKDSVYYICIYNNCVSDTPTNYTKCTQYMFACFGVKVKI